MFTFRKVYFIMIAAGLLLTACGAQGASSQPREVKITLSEFKIESSLTDFKVGVPYHFEVTNDGTVNHEIMIMPPVTADMGMDMHMEELDKMALVMIAEDKLIPGATASFDYTFVEPASAGSLELACHTPGHYEAGMKLPIVVQ